MIRKQYLIGLLFAFIINCNVGIFVYAQEFSIESIQNPKTKNTHAYVANPDNIISNRTENRINILLDSLEQETSSEVAVVLLNSIGDRDITETGVRLFEKWGIGKSTLDNGVLILFVLDKREIRFEVGYGLEGVLTDAVSSRIQRQDMLPYFKKGDYDTGMLSGIEKVALYVKQEEFVEKPQAERNFLFTGILSFSVILSLIITIISIINNVRTELGSNLEHYKKLRKTRNHIFIIVGVVIPVFALLIAIGLDDLSYLTFAGFQFLTPVPAFIISTIAMQIIRKRSITCNVCGGKMYLLTEKEEDKYLSKAQQLEEKIGSMDYDVFACKNCEHVQIFPLDKTSRYTKCPSCRTKAYGEKSKQVIVSPTYYKEGIEKITYECLYCGYKNHTNKRIPKLQNNANAVVAGGIIGSMLGGGRGGFGGGSFGGGSSGGGGAVGRW